VHTLFSQIVSSLVLATFAAWLAASILGQFKEGRLIQHIRRHDAFALIPIWTFFAPRPATQDFVILYRDMNSNGSLGPWREFHHRAPDPTLVRVIWNPRKRCQKILIDMCSQLLRLPRDVAGPWMVTQLPYIWLLSLVSTAPSDPFTVKRQFLVAQTDGFRTPASAPIFVSYLHELGQRAHAISRISG